jgi:SPP1 family predicted phage head-tail adaptor
MVRAGILRHRVRIQQWTDSGPDVLGQPQKTWQDVATVFGEVRDIRGREFWTSGQVESGEVTTRVRIRHRSNVDRNMRVLHAGRELMIEAVVDPNGRGQELHLMCREES